MGAIKFLTFAMLVPLTGCTTFECVGPSITSIINVDQRDSITALLKSLSKGFSDDSSLELLTIAGRQESNSTHREKSMCVSP